ncbi:MAG: carbohydrate binding domain-containing protein [Saccharofermentanales bacterium]
MKKIRLFKNYKIYNLALSVILSVSFIFSNMPNTVVTATTGNPRNSLVGAIRWDAWVGDLSSVGLEVEKTLGPNRYHDRIPFYGTEDGVDSVSVAQTTQVQMDDDIAYAKSAGIDYWAYCYYPASTNMDTALELHLSSSDSADVDWCYIFGRGSFADSNEVATMITRMQLSNYVTVNGDHPLVYLFGDSNWTSAELDILRDAADAADLPTLYITYMDFTASSASSMCTTLGCQAISAYCMGGSDGQAFAEGASDEAAAWDTYEATGKKVIPFVTTGWDPRPRIDNPVSWGQYYSNSWEQTATAAEIAGHLSDALQWSNDNQATVEANVVLMYAWNEFDEGGWICPTLYDGTERIDAIRNMLNGTTDTANRLINDGFENGTASWSAQACSFSAVSSNAKTGLSACRVYNRSAYYGSPIQDIKSILTTNGQGYYTASTWTRFTSGSDNVIIVVNINDSNGTHYFTSNAISVGTAYTKLEGNMNITWTGTLNTALIYVQSSSSTTDMYLDTFSFSKDPPNLLSNPGFESGTTSWTAQSCSIAANASSHTGSYACLASSRTYTWGSPVQDIRTILTTNGQGIYSSSAWVKLASGTDNVSIMIITNDDNGTHYLSRSTSVGTSYTKISNDNMYILWTGTLNSAYIEIQTSSSTANLYADDFTLTKTSTNLLANSEFESGTDSWSAQACSLATDTSNVRTGLNACLISSRSYAWGSPTQDIKSTLLSSGQGNYTSNAWTKFASGSDNVIVVVYTNDSGGSHWFSTTPVNVGTSYKKLEGNLNITWTGTLNTAIIYIQTISSTADMYLDGFSFNLTPGNLLSNPGFETGTTASWTGSGCSIAANASPHSGSYACLATSRLYRWSTPIQDVLSILTTNGQGNYNCNAWGKLASGSDYMAVWIITNDSEGTHYFISNPVTVSTSYVQFTADFNITWTGTLNSAYIEVQTSSVTTNMYCDDFSFGKY